jgi:hypothetical protein
MFDGVNLTAPANGYLEIPPWANMITSGYLAIGGKCSCSLKTPLKAINPPESGSSSHTGSFSTADMALPMVRVNLSDTSMKSFNLQASIVIHSPAPPNLTLRYDTGGKPMLHARLCARRMR